VESSLGVDSRVTTFETSLIGGVPFNSKEDSNAVSEELVSLGSGSQSLNQLTMVQDIMDEG
jgi:hypothetical protein